jgi:hypothetical protein
MIDEIELRGVDTWPNEAYMQLVDQLRAVGNGVTVIGADGRITLRLDGDMANLERESVYNDVQKTLDKAEFDHGLEATLLKIEKTDREDRADAEFQRGGDV